MSEVVDDTRYQFALLDLGQAAPLRERVTQLPPQAAVSLYGNDASDIERAYGPYLVWRSYVSRTWQLWKRDGWLQDWGMEVHAQATLVELRRHLKKFNFVRLTGQPELVRFGFYHPEVMRNWFRVAKPTQLATFFSGIDRLICPLPREPWVWRVDRPEKLPTPERVPLLFDEDQVSGFAALRVEDFTRRAIAFARKHVPAVKEHTDEMLHQALVTTQQQAGLVGISTEQHVMVLYMITLRQRTNVFADPDLAPTLHDQLLDPALRVRLLADRYL